MEKTHTSGTLAVSTGRGRHTLPLAGWTSTHAVSKCEGEEEMDEEEEERDTRLIMIIIIVFIPKGHCLHAAITSSYFLSASSARNRASLSWFSRASMRSSSDRERFSSTLRMLWGGVSPGVSGGRDAAESHMTYDGCSCCSLAARASALRKQD